MKRFRTVDDYITAAENWQDELVRLREILNSTPLTETVKWGAPCYTWNDKLVVGLGAFKSYVGLWFYQGALLSDPDQVLINAQEGRTKAMRQWRFASKREIRATRIRAYVKEAIALQESGKEIRPDRSRPVVVPPELQAALATHKAVAAQFRLLSKGRQREYAQYISEAKQQATRDRRIRRILPMIEAGVGLHDKYRC